MKALGLVLFLAVSGFAADAAPRVVKITARKFQFDPPEVHLKVGEPVVLELTSLDRTHGFKIEELGLRVDVTTGAIVQVPFTPVKSGTFTFRCDLFCGIGHEDMNGTLVIEE